MRADFETKHGVAYRRAVAAAERHATPGYQPGQLPSRVPLDEHEKRRQQANNGAAAYWFTQDEERIRRMAARP